MVNNLEIPLHCWFASDTFLIIIELFANNLDINNKNQLFFNKIHNSTAPHEKARIYIYLQVNRINKSKQNYTPTGVCFFPGYKDLTYLIELKIEKGKKLYI